MLECCVLSSRRVTEMSKTFTENRRFHFDSRIFVQLVMWCSMCGRWTQLQNLTRRPRPVWSNKSKRIERPLCVAVCRLSSKCTGSINKSTMLSLRYQVVWAMQQCRQSKAICVWDVQVSCCSPLDFRRLGWSLLWLDFDWWSDGLDFCRRAQASLLVKTSGKKIES